MASLKFDIVAENKQFLSNWKQVHDAVQKTSTLLSGMSLDSTKILSQLSGLVNGLNNVASSATKATQSMAGINRMSTQKAASGMRDMSQSASEMNSKMRDSESIMGGVTSSIGNFAKGFTAAALAVKGVNIALDAIKGSWNTLTGFQSANAQLSAILGQAPEQMGNLIESAKELGRRTIFTSSQVTQLQIELSKLGFKEQDILAMSDSTLQFAMATGANLGEAAATTGAALRMFGATTDEADRYTAAMAAATTNSALNFQAISDNLATFGPMAHSIGFSIEDVLALFGKLKDAGIEGSTAMTSLRNIFTKVASGKVEGMENVNGLEDFVNKLTALNEKYQGLGGAAAAIKDIGTRGGTQFMTLIQAAGDAENGILALKDRIVQSEQGALGEMSSKMTNTVEGSLKMLSSAWEGFIIEFGDSSLGPVKTALDYLSELINGVTDLISGKSWDELEGTTQILIGSLGVLTTGFLAWQGVLKGSDIIMQKQVENYQKFEEELQKTVNLKGKDLDADIKAMVGRKNLTEAQAVTVQQTRNDLIAEKERLALRKQEIVDNKTALRGQLEEAKQKADLANKNYKLAQSEEDVARQMVEDAEKQEIATRGTQDHAKAVNDLVHAQENLRQKQTAVAKAQQVANDADDEFLEKRKEVVPILKEEKKALGEVEEQMDTNTKVNKAFEEGLKGMDEKGGGVFKKIGTSIVEMGKSLLSSPMFWITGAIWAVGEALEIYKLKTNAAENAQKALNDVLDLQRKEIDDIKSSWSEHLSVINDTNASLRDQVLHYNELKKVIGELNGMTLAEFQALSADEQEKILRDNVRKTEEENKKILYELGKELSNYRVLDYGGHYRDITGREAKAVIQRYIDKEKITKEEGDKFLDQLSVWMNTEETKAWIDKYFGGVVKEYQDALFTGIQDSMSHLQQSFDKIKLPSTSKIGVDEIKTALLDLQSNMKLLENGNVKLDTRSVESARKQMEDLAKSMESQSENLERQKRDMLAQNGNADTTDIQSQIDAAENVKEQVQEMLNLLNEAAQGKEIPVEVIEKINAIYSIQPDIEAQAKLDQMFDDVKSKATELHAALTEQLTMTGNESASVVEKINQRVSNASSAMRKSIDENKAAVSKRISELESELSKTTNKDRRVQIRAEINNAKYRLLELEGWWLQVKRIIEAPAVLKVLINIFGEERLNALLSKVSKASAPKTPTNKEGGDKNTPTTEDHNAQKKAEEKQRAEQKQAAEEAKKQAAADKARQQAEEARRKAEEAKRRADEAKKELDSTMKALKISNEDLANNLEDNPLTRELAKLNIDLARELKKIDDELTKVEKTAKKAGRVLTDAERKTFTDQKALTQQNYQKRIKEKIDSYFPTREGLDLEVFNLMKEYNQKREALNKALGDKNDGTLEERLGILDTGYKKKMDALFDGIISKHASYIDKRKKIENDYQNDVKDINDAITLAQGRNDQERVDALRRSLAEAAKNYHKSMSDLSFAELKESPDYIRAFEDLGNSSSATLEYLIGEFEKVKDSAAKYLKPDELREYTNTIRQMQEELYNRDPFKALEDSLVELANAQTKASVAQRDYENVKNGAKIVDRFEMQEGKLVPVYLSEAEALARVRAATDDVYKARNRVSNAIKKSKDLIDDLAGQISGLGNAIGGTGGQIIGVISQVMTFATSTIDNIAKLGEITAKEVSATVKAIESASVILAIASAALSLIKSIDSLLPSSDSNFEKAQRKQKEINDMRKAVEQYSMAVLKAQQAERGWFSENSLQSLQDQYEVHGKVVESYFSQLYEAQKIYQNKSSGLKKYALPIVAAVGTAVAGALTFGVGSTIVGAIAGLALDAAAGYMVGKGAQSAIDAITYADGETAAINNLRIQTRKSNFWHGEKTEDLQTWLNKQKGFENVSLFDAEGLIDAELGKTILDKWGDKLVGETKETLEALVDLKEQYDEFMNSIEEYVSQLYSPLVNNMTDALWDWLKTGQDVMGRFKEYASSTFAEVAKDMVRQILLNNVFDELKESLKNATAGFAMTGDTTTYLASIIDATDNFMSKADTQIPIIQEALKYMDERFKDLGIDITGDSSASGTSRGVSAMTQDAAEELNGRFTAIQISNESINQQMALAVGQLMMIGQYSTANSTFLSDLRVIEESSNHYLEDISKYNKSIYVDFSEKLDKVITNTNKL
ncbi:MAG: phage tail tape measure protein [Bacteroidaceae bacterium]